MPESIEDFHARALAAQEAAGGHLPLPEDGYTTWAAFPFDGDLTVKALAPLADEEAAREGDNPAECHCAPSTPARPDWPVRWRDEHWLVKQAPPSGSPAIFVLEPLEHLDMHELSRDRAAEYGVLSVALVQAIEALPSVGRCHIGRWGDGGAHGHVWFIARPTRTPQLRGTFNTLWDDLLPPIPQDVWREHAGAVIAHLVATVGGEGVDD